MVRWMYKVDVYLRVRRAVMVEGKSIGEAARVFGLHRDTVRRLLCRLIWQPRGSPELALAWSHWRRRHQARARRCHYQNRLPNLHQYVRL